MRVAHCRLPIADCLLPIAFSRRILPTAYCRLPIACCLLLLSSFLLPPSSFALTDSWGVDVNAHTAVQRTYKQGETWEMRIALRDGLKPLNLTGATARFYWYTNSTDNVWWTNSAAITAPATGLVTVPWTPAMDVGAPAYTYWLGIWQAGSTSPLWRVTGTIRMLTSPGFTPNAQPVPVRTLDFSAITVTNAPWLTAADWQSSSNALAGAIQALATQRVERVWSTDGTEYRDGTGGVWRVVSVPQGYWTLSVLSTEYGTATNAYYEIRTAPFDFWNSTRGFSDPTTWAYFVWHVNPENAGQGQIYVEVQGEEGTHDGFFETNQVATGSIEFATTMNHTLLRLAWSNEAPTVATQHVATVALESSQAGYATRAEIPAIVMSNSVSSLIVWTNDVGAATNMAWRENGTWHTNAFGGGAVLPEGIVTNGQPGPLTLGRMQFDNVHPNVAASLGSTTQWGLNITGNPWEADGYNNNQNRSVVRIASAGTWIGTQYALYVEGYTYLGGFRVNGSGPERNLYKDTEIGFGSPVAMRFSTDKFALPELRITPGVVRANYALNVAGTNTSSIFVETGTPSWIVMTNIASACTLTNDNLRPARIFAAAGAEASTTGAVSFANLRTDAAPVYFTVQGFRELRFPTAYVVGGGSWQTNRVNIFTAWLDGTNTFVSPITTREIY